jgi:uncharacterized protein
MSALVLGFGMVFVIEGLVLALAPSRLEDLLDAVRDIPPDTRRLIGLGAIAVGVFLVWLARGLGF